MSDCSAFSLRYARNKQGGVSGRKAMARVKSAGSTSTIRGSVLNDTKLPRMNASTVPRLRHTGSSEPSMPRMRESAMSATKRGTIRRMPPPAMPANTRPMQSCRTLFPKMTHSQNAWKGGKSKLKLAKLLSRHCKFLPREESR